VRAERIASAALPPKSFARRLPGVGWIVQTPRPDVVILDERLIEVKRFTLSSAWRASHWVTPDLAFLAVSDRAAVLLADDRGRVVWRTAHHPWGGGDSESGSCWVSPDGEHLWATTPTPTGADQWLVLDSSDGRILGSTQLQCYAAGSNPIPHPDRRHVGLSVGEGQDGSEVYWGRWDDGRPVVLRLDDRSRVLTDVRPSGGQYLTTPHSNLSGRIVVHAFPNGRVVGELSPEGLIAENDWFDFAAGYISEDLILVGSTEEQKHIVLSADSLAPIGTVEYPTGSAKEDITTTGMGAWLTSDYLSGRHELWRLGDDA
jgi:hypothetical protein